MKLKVEVKWLAWLNLEDSARLKGEAVGSLASIKEKEGKFSSLQSKSNHQAPSKSYQKRRTFCHGTWCLP
jgi:hypothetical protein